MIAPPGEYDVEWDGFTADTTPACVLTAIQHLINDGMAVNAAVDMITGAYMNGRDVRALTTHLIRLRHVECARC